MNVRTSALVGRHRELALVDQILAGAPGGAGGGLLVIRGEAGIGKSRLAEEMAVRAEAAGFGVARGRCWPLAGAPPLWPWHEVLETLAGSSAAGLLEEQGPGTGIDPERFARFRAVADMLAESAERAPLLILLDDMHAADPGAVLLARFLARSPRLRRLVLVVTHRVPLAEGDPAASVLAELQRDGAIVRLGGLSQSEVAELAARHERPLDPEQLGAVHHVTRGNPFLVEELLASAPTAQIGHDHAAFRRAVVSRLLELSVGHRRVVTAAAVLGAQASLADLAAICQTSILAVDGLRRDLVDTGMVEPEGSGVVFAHDMIREAILAELDRAELVMWHGRAAEALAPGEGARDAERLARWAHHAMEAAGAGPEASTTAVNACREAARAMMHGFGYEAAATLLRSAVELSGRAGRSDADAALLVDYAEATLATGDLAAARRAFRRAAAAAETAGEAPLLAQAALGLGGIWVLEHRAADELEAYHGVVRRAAAALGAERPDLAARLHTRLAAEMFYIGEGTMEEVERAVASVRATGDDRAIAEALSLEHHVKLGPAYADERIDIAAEVIRTASASGDGVRTLIGLMWRTVDLLLLGRPEAERSLTELRQRIDALAVEAVRLIAKHIEVMHLQRAGRFEDAERAAEACLEFGTRIGDPDAAAWFAGQLLARRWFEGRALDLYPLSEELAQSPDLPMTNQVFTAAWAALAAEAGRVDRVEIAFERLRGQGGLGAIAQSSTLLLTMFCTVEAAGTVGDAAVAEEAYAVLAPYAGLPIIGSLGVICFGSVERSLGIAARTTGDLDRAVAHLERAVDANRRLGNRPMHAITQADLAETLQRRDGPRDRERAALLLDEATGAADLFAMDARAATWRERLGELAAPPPDVGRFRRMGDHWEIAAGREHAVVPDSIGLQYLARLLAQPGRPITAGELAGREAAESHHVVLDDRAKEAYRRRVLDLRADLDEAEADADIERAARMRMELDALTDELTRMLRPGGRSRAFAGPQERARTAVQKAIRRSLDRIATDAPVLAEGLRATVRTGTECSFEPSNGVPGHWIVS